MKGINLRSTGILIISYLFGQGSYFFLLLFLRKEIEPELVGEIVLLFSVISLCFQFSDIGNPTIGVKLHSKSTMEGFYSFLRGRGLIAFCTVLLFLVHLSDILKLNNYYLLSVFFVLASLLFGMSSSARLESENKYFLYSVLQSSNWVLTCIIISLVYMFECITLTLGIMLWFVIPCIYFICSHGHGLRKFIRSLKKTNQEDILYPLSVVAPAIIGQVWGREMMVIVASSVSLSILGPLGIMRSVHTAGSMLFTMFLRPHFRALSKESVSNINFEFGKEQRYFFVFTFTLFLILCIYSLYPYGMPEDLAYWSPILTGIPLWAVCSYLVNINQIYFPPRRFFIIESLSYLFHAIGFVSLVNYSAPWSFVLADVSKLMFLSVVAVYIRYIDRGINSKKLEKKDNEII